MDPREAIMGQRFRSAPALRNVKRGAFMWRMRARYELLIEWIPAEDRAALPQYRRSMTQYRMISRVFRGWSPQRAHAAAVIWIFHRYRPDIPDGALLWRVDVLCVRIGPHY